MFVENLPLTKEMVVHLRLAFARWVKFVVLEETPLVADGQKECHVAASSKRELTDAAFEERVVVAASDIWKECSVATSPKGGRLYVALEEQVVLMVFDIEEVCSVAAASAGEHPDPASEEQDGRVVDHYEGCFVGASQMEEQSDLGPDGQPAVAQWWLLSPACSSHSPC